MASQPHLKGPSSEVGQAHVGSMMFFEDRFEQSSRVEPMHCGTAVKLMTQVPSVGSDMSTKASCASCDSCSKASYPASYAEAPRLPAVEDSNSASDSVVGNAQEQKSNGRPRWLHCLVPCLPKPEPPEREVSVYGVDGALHKIVIKENGTIGELVLKAMIKDGQWPPKRRLDRGRLQSFDGKKFNSEMTVAEIPLGVKLRLVIRNLGDIASARCDCSLAGPCDTCQDRCSFSTSTRVHYSSNHESISASSDTSLP